MEPEVAKAYQSPWCVTEDTTQIKREIMVCSINRTCIIQVTGGEIKLHQDITHLPIKNKPRCVED